MPDKTGLQFTAKVGTLPEDTFAVVDFTLDEALNPPFTPDLHTVAGDNLPEVAGEQQITTGKNHLFNVNGTLHIHAENGSVVLTTPGGIIELNHDGSIRIAGKYIRMEADRIDLNPGNGAEDLSLPEPDSVQYPGLPQENIPELAALTVTEEKNQGNHLFSSLPDNWHILLDKITDNSVPESAGNAAVEVDDNSPCPDPLPLPCTIYETLHKMDDYSAPDMKYGDLTDIQLMKQYGVYIGEYKLMAIECLEHIEIARSGKPNYDHENLLKPEEREKAHKFEKIKKLRKLTEQEKWQQLKEPSQIQYLRQLEDELILLNKEVIKCSASKIFNEFRNWAGMLSYGEYSGIILKLIQHAQDNTGTPFSDPLLDQAMKERIINDTDEGKSTYIIIKQTLENFINKRCRLYPLTEKNQFYEKIQKGNLPKFSGWKDYINGLGVAVHDTWATHIILESLTVDDNKFSATVRYHVQDHFGLDDHDIGDFPATHLSFMKGWFVLQRWDRYGYKPFITEFNVTVNIEGKLS